MILKCKPVYQFQSIEFDYEITDKRDLPKLFDLYTEVLNGLMLIAPDQKKELTQQTVKVVKLASERQREIMRKFDIPFTLETTSDEAQKLIQESVSKAAK